MCEREKGRGVLLPLWARGKSNKIELMGVWSFRGQSVGFAGRQALVGSGGCGDEEDGIRSSEFLAKRRSPTPAFNCRW